MHSFYVDKTSFSYARRIEALDEGFNVLMAVADTVKDSITLEKGYRSICGCSGIPFCMGAAGYTVQAAAACAYDPHGFERCGHSDPEIQHSKSTAFNLSSVHTYRKYASFYTLIKYKKL